MSAASGINPADVVTAGGFLVVVIGAMVVHAFKATAQESPRARMLKRAKDAAGVEKAPGTVLAEPENALKASLARSDRWTARAVEQMKRKIQHVGGTIALNWMLGSGLASVVAAIAVIKTFGLSPWLNVPAIPLAAVGGAIAAFAVMTQIYRRRFLNAFPDALELIIRAVRAGVPVIQAIRTAGKELPDPVGREFRQIGDALRLGQDQDEVMEAAARRIGLPDFRFFAVCLQLQRETGGPLAETLENLAGIIRSRREILLKTRALTAQGRMSSKIIALVPVVTVGALQMIGDGYLDVLFDTPAGNKVLWLACGMIFTGLFIINRMAKLED